MLHAPILETRQFDWPDEAACAAWAAALAGRPELQDAHITLRGPLGAGKTSFVRHLLRALGVTGRVKSPTYTVVEPYQIGDLVVSHFDFYRFDDPRELEDAGLREVFAAPGLKLCEWPDKAGVLLPAADLALYLDFAPTAEGRDTPATVARADTADIADTADARAVRAEALSPRGQALLP